jgi:hypothetical protein
MAARKRKQWRSTTRARARNSFASIGGFRISDSGKLRSFRPQNDLCHALCASLLLNFSRDQKMRDEPEQKRDETDPRIQSHRDQQLGDTEQPDKALSREGLAPVGLEISGRNARPQRRQETWHRSAIRTIRFPLSFQQGFFFAKN